MEPYKSIISPSAQASIREARKWYRSISPELSKSLMAEINEILRKIVRSPHSYGVRFMDVRRVNLSRFPYAVFFTINEEETTVVFLRFFHIKMKMPYPDTEGAEPIIHEPQTISIS